MSLPLDFIDGFDDLEPKPARRAQHAREPAPWKAAAVPIARGTFTVWLDNQSGRVVTHWRLDTRRPEARP